MNTPYQPSCTDFSGLWSSSSKPQLPGLIVTVEPDAKQGLGLADIGSAMRAGTITQVGTGAVLRDDPEAASFFLG
jgi:ABC-type branched-subunit amino acid transport system ATPase component